MIILTLDDFHLVTQRFYRKLSSTIRYLVRQVSKLNCSRNYVSAGKTDLTSPRWIHMVMFQFLNS